MMDVNQVREFVIRNTLLEFDNEPFIRSIRGDVKTYSEGAEELLILTAAVESGLGRYVKQESGPALGLYQMEPATFKDTFRHWKDMKIDLVIRFICNFSFEPTEHEMVTNMKFSTLMARLHYYRFPEPMPDKGDIDGLWKFYKKRWNTEEGKTTKDEFMLSYNLVSGKKLA